MRQGIVTAVHEKQAVVLKQDGTFVEMKNKNYTIGQTISIPEQSLKKYASLAASVALLLIGGISGYTLSRTATSYVYVDINPSMRLDINTFDSVIDVVPLNEDAKQLLSVAKVYNKDVQICVENIISACEEAKFINESNTDVELSVMSSDTEIKKAVASVAEHHTETLQISTGEVTKEQCEDASATGISAGRLKAVQSYAEYFGGTMEENISKLEDFSIKKIYSEISKAKSEAEQAEREAKRQAEAEQREKEKVEREEQRQEEAEQREKEKMEREEQRQTETEQRMTKHKFTTSSGEKMNYWLYTPEGATEDMPLIVYLHGGSGKGNDPKLIMESDGFPKYLQDGLLTPEAYVLIPQLGSEKDEWKNTKEDLIQLISRIGRKYKIDMERVSLTGHSMGGTGCWQIAADCTDVFSCVAPLSGTVKITEKNLEKFSEIPVWAIVGDADTVVEPESSVKFIEELQKVNDGAKLTVLKDVDHFGVPSSVYLDKEVNILEWLTEQKRK